LWVNGRKLELKTVQEINKLIRMRCMKIFHRTYMQIVGRSIRPLQRAIELSVLKMERASCPFAWLNIGSQGRKEQLLLTDQDSALVF
jgi:CBS domain-containing protein